MAAIETKGLSGLSDQMQHEYLAAKKAFCYEQEMQDPVLKKLCADVAAAHRTRYERMMNFLNANG